METKITTVSLATKEDKYYADKTLYQWNYGQILRIIDADLPMAVEIGFQLQKNQEIQTCGLDLLTTVLLR